MRYIIGAITIILFGAVLLSMVTATRERTAVDWARQEAALARIERQEALDEAVQPVKLTMALLWSVVPFLAALGGLGYVGGLAVAHLRRVWYERVPDRRGLVPVPVEYLGAVGPGALDAYHLTARESARNPALPHTLHYSPKVEQRAEQSRVEPITPTLSLPGLVDLATLNYRPSLDAILLGLGPGGEQLTVPARALCHVALVGATGGGKSNLLRLLLPQLQSVGARVVLADPHYTPFDVESGDDWRLIESGLHLPPAVTADQIGGLFAYLTDELERRIERRRKGERCGPSLFLAMDELPVIADTVPESIEHLGRLLREGRKCGLFTIGAAQSMLVKVIGGDSSAREAYRTAYYVGGDVRSAAALLDMPQRAIDDGQCSTGIAYLRSVKTAPAQLVRVPYVSNAALETLLGATSVPTSTSGQIDRVGSGLEVGTEVGSGYPLPGHQEALKDTTQAARILEALKAGQTPGEVAATLAGSRGGRKYQEASKHVAEVITQCLKNS
ncbi:helicase HerA domain-containing protein [Candidatus Chloroploca asiatica]|uniref:FtsK domain-containing protein n=1 Tax=Candidatus Chloroploca asiatica TaxID=1506545 RepID=A0A2H3KT91_9CHLR|nr:DUF87 domain-containing protein [Candidatus Chloroploca asiatica]PDW00979.1 hypothetical protein A9Q02_21355 [Candidatus Chloroploca asiatica]